MALAFITAAPARDGEIGIAVSVSVAGPIRTDFDTLSGMAVSVSVAGPMIRVWAL